MEPAGMHLRHFFQNAYVTRDLAVAEAIIRDRHGIDDWVHFEPEMDVYTATDGQGMAHVKVALGWAGNLQIELIEPVSDNVRLYQERLPADKDDATPQFHHICMRVADWEGTMVQVTEGGWPVAYRGGVPGCEFVYIDARESLGHYVEYMWMSDEMWAGSGGPANITG